jgi:tetratricopeptide (TPR) repeat protein
MGRHLLLVIFLCFIYSPTWLRAEKKSYTIFPLCAANGYNQSERLNNFHIFLAELGEKLQLNGITTLPVKSQISNCETSMRRSIAALYNLQGFVQGQYKIIGDSVSITMQFVNTLYVDKTQELNKVEGNIQTFNDVLFKMTLAAFQALSMETDTQQIASIVQWIAEDEKKYIVSNSNFNNGKIELGKLAYGLGNYEKAMESLLPIESGEAAYAEAQFILGKCVLIVNDYHKALNYFILAKKAGFNEPELDDYIYQARKLNKPAEWFDTEKKRKDWWLELNENEVGLIINLMNSLKINQSKFKPDYQFIDADVRLLFSAEVLSLNDCKLSDMVLFKHFTRN